MFRQANINNESMKTLWTHGIKILERLKNMTITRANKDNQTPNDLFGMKDDKISKHLIEFIRIGYVTDRKKVKGKMKPRSFRCIMIGYADNHSPDTYLMCNPRTKKKIIIRDIRWTDFEIPQPTGGSDTHRNREEITRNTQ